MIIQTAVVCMLVTSTLTFDCQPGEYETHDGTCARCSFRCLTCSIAQDNCDSCRPGYFYSKPKDLGLCKVCNFGCKKCSSTDACDECHSRFYYSKGECDSCIANCDACNTYENCLSCSPGFTKSAARGSDSCLKAASNYEYFGILLYLIISGLVIWLLVETVKRNQRYRAGGYLITYKATETQEDLNPDRENELIHSMGSMQESPQSKLAKVANIDSKLSMIDN